MKRTIALLAFVPISLLAGGCQNAEKPRVQRENAAIERAKAEASRVAGTNDQVFARVFTSSLNSALDPGRADSADASAFADDPAYAANLRGMLEFAPAATLQPRIIGDITVEFPDCVAVGGARDWCCSGTLVAKNVVVTAGHCNASCASRVFIGPSVFGPGETVKVIRSVPHPRYRGNPAFDNDLTVLILERDVTTVAPRSIAKPEVINGASWVRLVGYGYGDRWRLSGKGVKREADVAAVSLACSRPGDPGKYGCHAGLEMVCADPAAVKDSCFGDSGGPAYVLSGNDWYLAGCTSRGVVPSQKDCGDGGVYVRADAYSDWIRSVPGGHWD